MMEASHQERMMMTDPVVYYFVSQVTVVLCVLLHFICVPN